MAHVHCMLDNEGYRHTFRKKGKRKVHPRTGHEGPERGKGKGGRCVRLTTLSPSCAVVMKSRNLNFLEASGPLQACNGTALPLPYE